MLDAEARGDIADAAGYFGSVEVTVGHENPALTLR